MNQFSLCPDSFNFLAVLVSLNAFSVHLSFLPVTFIFSNIRPVEYSIAMSQISFETSLISSTIRPLVAAFPAHHVVNPTSDIASVIWPLIVPFAFHLISYPISSVRCTIGPNIGSLSILLALGKMTFIPRAISPTFLSKPMIKIVIPLSFKSFASICSSEDTLSVS